VHVEKSWNLNLPGSTAYQWDFLEFIGRSAGSIDDGTTLNHNMSTLIFTLTVLESLVFLQT
jgi:hypothetical protein